MSAIKRIYDDIIAMYMDNISITDISKAVNMPVEQVEAAINMFKESDKYEKED